MPESANSLDDDAFDRLEKSVLLSESMPRTAPPTVETPRPRSDPASSVVALVEDLDSGKAVISLALERSDRPVQIVTIPKQSDDGAFRLQATGGDQSDPIAWDATPNQALTALRAISGFTPNTIAVGLGTYIRSNGTQFPTRRWFIKFLKDDNPGLLVPFQDASAILGPSTSGSALTNQKHFLFPTSPGLEIVVWGIVPLSDAAQVLPAGTITTVDWFPRIGYGVPGTECKDCIPSCECVEGY